MKRSIPLLCCLVLPALTGCVDRCVFSVEVCETNLVISNISSPYVITYQKSHALSISELTLEGMDKPWPEFNGGLKLVLKENPSPDIRPEIFVLEFKAEDPPSTVPLEALETWLKDQPTDMPHTFKLSAYHQNSELPAATATSYPQITVKPMPDVSWQQATSSPLQLPAESNTNTLSARGVWVGRSAPPPQLAEILLLREYVDNGSGGFSKSRVSRLGGPTTSWVGASQAEPGSQFALWSFGQASEVPHAAYLTLSSSMYGVSQGVLMTPDVMNTTGKAFGGFTVNAMAAVSPKGQKGTIALLMQTMDMGLQSYLSTGSGTGMTMPVSLPPEAPTSLKLLAPWADQADGGAGVGVLGMEPSSGEPVQLDFNGSTFVFNMSKSDALRTALGKAAATAIATGDADGDGKNDIVVARGSVVQVYLQQNSTFVKAATELTLPTDVSAAAVAIGQVDGQGKNDLVVADSQERSCGGQPCNHVYVYLNISQ